MGHYKQLTTGSENIPPPQKKNKKNNLWSREDNTAEDLGLHTWTI